MTDPSAMTPNILELSHDLPAPPDVVFAIWTEPRFVRIWFAASHGFRVERCSIDLRPGGIWRLVTSRRGVEDHPWGVYHEVISPRRLVYSYLFAGTDFHSTVSVEFEGTALGTHVKLRQTGFPDADAFQQHALGWRFVLELLEQALLSPVAVLQPEVYKIITAEQQLTGVERDIQAAKERAEAAGKLVQEP